MNFVTGIHATSSALTAEQMRLDIVAQNIANAYTTKDTDGTLTNGVLYPSKHCLAA
jgi:flagellar basal body rod protein FlgC